MRIFSLTLILLVFFGCRQTKDQNVDKWVTQINKEVLGEISFQIVNGGNRKFDLAILEKSQEFTKHLDSLLNSSKQLNRTDAEQFVTNWLNKLEINDVRFEKYQSHSNFNDSKKVRLALFGHEILKYLQMQIGRTEIRFDKMDLIFVPDNIRNCGKSNLRGKLILAATSKKIGKIGKMYIDGKEIDIKNGTGIVDIPLTQNKKTFTVSIKTEFDDIEKKITVF